MFITIDKKDVESTIKRYYEEVEGDNVDVSFSTYDGDYIYAEGTTINVSRNNTINGIRFESEETISDDELKEIFNYYIGKIYDVRSVIRKVDYVTSGYGMGERTKLDFIGLKLDVNKKEKVKKLGGKYENN